MKKGIKTKINLDIIEVSDIKEKTKSSDKIKSLRVLQKNCKADLLLSKTYPQKDSKSPEKQPIIIQSPNANLQLSQESTLYLKTVKTKSLLNYIKIQTPQDNVINNESKKCNYKILKSDSPFNKSQYNKIKGVRDEKERR